MNIEHIVWKNWNWSDKDVTGILEISAHRHGGGSDAIIMEGTYNGNFRGKFSNRILTIDEDTMGVSGITLLRVGEIVS